MNLNKNLLCLKWDDFDNFVVSGLSNLYQKDDMSDTTLFCDGRSFKAHKIVLSIWSIYFREIFSTTTHAHPVIVLRETTSSDLELILRFIYQGQLFVPFEDTERFLKTAEYFQIAGLRDMRVHLSSSERNPTGSLTSKSLIGPTGSNNVGNYPSPLSGNSTQSSLSQQSFLEPQPPSYVIQGVNSSATTTVTSSIDGIPVQIMSSSASASTASPTTHTGHPSSVNPNSSTGIMNNSSLPSTQSPFSTNVIKPIPSRQTSRLHHQPVLSPSNNITLSAPPLSYNSHNLPNPCSRQGQGGHDLMYNTQPILIVHNQQQKQNEYHPHHESSKGPVESLRPSATEQVQVVFERMSNGLSPHHVDRKISSMQHETVVASGLNDYNYNAQVHQEQEEVLGLAYLHDNTNSSSRTSSNHSHLIQEAAIAAGVATEDTEIIEIDDRDPCPPNDVVMNGVPHGKIMNTSPPAVPSTSPVYAVKRVPSHSQTTTLTNSDTPKACTSSSKVKVTTSSTTSTFKDSKSKNRRRQKKISPVQSAEIEFVNCPRCDKRVKKSSLKVHIKRTHLEEGIVLICPICGKQISSKGVMYKHMYAHRQTSKPKKESRT